MNNRVLTKVLSASLCAATLLGAGPARAEAPQLKTQVPGYYRLTVGKTEVTALSDGVTVLDAGLLKNASPDDIQRLLARQFVEHPKMQTSVNGYLINTGDKLVLVDTGGARLNRPTMGKLADNLKASGYRPEQVDTVLITHFHGDHVGGLLNADGAPVFPKAEVRMSKTEADFWTSQDNADKAAEGRKPTFKMARDLAAALSAAGKWKPFAYGEEVAPGIKAMAIPGHTPGHSAYAVNSEGQQLVLWGDLVHSYAVQFTKPGVTIDFDSDQPQAAASRAKLFQQLAADRALVGGAHLPFPGLGHVRADSDGSYAWIPAEFGPVK